MSHSENINLNMNEIGPSIWDTMHSFATQVTNQKKFQAFLLFIASIKELLPCEECRRHFILFAQKMLDKNSDLYIYNFNYKNGVFYWTWLVHNMVNERLGKPNFPYKTAYKMYYKSNNNVCKESCKFHNDNDHSNYY